MMFRVTFSPIEYLKNPMLGRVSSSGLTRRTGMCAINIHRTVLILIELVRTLNSIQFHTET